MSTRLAIDIGGTFTDVVLQHETEQTTTKVLTTHDDPTNGALAGVTAVLDESNVETDSIEMVVHGTTLATNALIERKGAKTGLIATEGFRDSVEIAYEHRFEQYDLYMDRPTPLVPRHRRLGVWERMAADGSILLPLDEEAVVGQARALRVEGIEALAICFLHSYMNAAHEERALELVAGELPHVAVTISSEVCPEIREYERMSTAALDTAQLYSRTSHVTEITHLIDEVCKV